MTVKRFRIVEKRQITRGADPFGIALKVTAVDFLRHTPPPAVTLSIEPASWREYAYLAESGREFIRRQQQMQFEFKRKPTRAFKRLERKIFRQLREFEFKVLVNQGVAPFSKCCLVRRVRICEPPIAADAAGETIRP